jgi:hypothetical protein
MSYSVTHEDIQRVIDMLDRIGDRIGDNELLQVRAELVHIQPKKEPAPYVRPKCKNCGFEFSAHQQSLSFGHLRTYGHLNCPSPNTTEIPSRGFQCGLISLYSLY